MSQRKCPQWLASVRPYLDRAWARIGPTRNRSPLDRLLRIEPLEDRRPLAITVNTLVDELDGSTVDGDISLRDAIAASPAGDTINFSVIGTINLTLGELILNGHTIDGGDPGLLTINAGGLSRVFKTSGTTTLAGLTITGGINSAIRAEGDLIVRDSVITGNTGVLGGGIYIGVSLEPDLTVVNSTISGNTAVRGGGVYGGPSSILTFVRSTISGNSADEGGGVHGTVLFGNFSLPRFFNSTISGNPANAGEGGGVQSRFIDAYQSTFSGNTGGAIMVSEESHVIQSTIARNDVGIIAPGSTMTLQNSVVALNTRNFQFQHTVNAATSRNNLIGEGGPNYSGGLVNGVNGNRVGVAEPGLGALTNNGGPTQTHALLSFSPAINAGDNSLIPIDPATQQPFAVDQLGNARIFAGGAVDIGAHEFQGTVVPSTVVNTILDEVDFNSTTSLREAVGFATSLGLPVVTFDPGVFASPQTIVLSLGGIAVSATEGPLAISGPGAGLLTIDGNLAVIIGGLLRVSGTEKVSLSGLTITRGGSGAIGNSGDLTISRSAITASLHAGGIHNFRGTLIVEDSTISGNSAISGGGISNYGGDVTVRNSTISGNMALELGGGIYSTNIPEEATLVVINSTIVNNTAADVAGGINADTIFMAHSIVSGNLAGIEPHNLAIGEADPASGYNLVGDASISGGLVHGVNGNIVGANPLLGPLADNGGATPTHALLPGSPAIDAGDPAAVAGAVDIPPYDQRGFAFSRVIDGDGTGPPRIDIGAFEVHALPTAMPSLLGDYNENGEVDAADYVFWRKALGTTGLAAFSGADGNGNGVIDPPDHGAWRAHFGESVPPAAVAGASSVARQSPGVAANVEVPTPGEVVTSAPRDGELTVPTPAEEIDDTLTSRATPAVGAEAVPLGNATRPPSVRARNLATVRSEGTTAVLHDYALLAWSTSARREVSPLFEYDFDGKQFEDSARADGFESHSVDEIFAGRAIGRAFEF